MIDPKYKRRQRVAYEPRISLGAIGPRRIGTVRNDPEFCAGCWRYSIDFDNGGTAPWVVLVPSRFFRHFRHCECRVYITANKLPFRLNRRNSCRARSSEWVDHQVTRV
jgi:hypothetical protein